MRRGGNEKERRGGKGKEGRQEGNKRTFSLPGRDSGAGGLLDTF